jgi:prophage regulatory protein
MTASSHLPHTILRRKQVEARTGLSRSTIYDKLSKKSPRFDPTFPRAIKLGINAVGWVEAEIDSWLHNRTQMNRV